MFNSTTNRNSAEINTAATGIIQKSNNYSYFIAMHQNSPLAKKIFDANPTYKGEQITVLQVMLTNESNVLAEIVETRKLNQ